MDKNYYMQEPIGREGIAQVTNPARISPRGAFVNSPMGINVGKYFNNNTIGSKYLDQIGDINDAYATGRTVEDLLAEKQSGWDMAANALVNNLVIAGTTVVSGTIGLVDGLLEATATADISKLWDNATNNWAVDTQNAMKEAMPIYRGSDYEDSSIWDKMGTGIFWADLFENLGFTEGMLVPGLAASKALSFLPKIVRGVAGAMVSSIGEGSIEAINARNDEVNNKIAIANQRYNELASRITDPDELDALYSSYQQTLQEIHEDANNAGNFTLGANIALLTLTNSIEFGGLFSRGFSTARRTMHTLELGADGLMKAGGTTANLLKTLGKKGIDAFSEGMEEVSQAAISNTAQYYDNFNRFNESEFNPEKRELLGDLISAFGESYAQTLQDPQTAEEFTSGFLIGLTGVPMLRRGKIPITMENNIIGEMVDSYKQNKREQDLANTINDRLQNSKEFNAYYNGLVRHLSLEDDANRAITMDDKVMFGDAKSSQLISDIMMFHDAGQLDYLKKLINESVDLSDEGIDAIIENTTKDGEGPFIRNGNKDSVESVRETIQRKLDNINSSIKYFVNTKNEIETAYPELKEEDVKNAVFLRAKLEDNSNRQGELLDSTRARINKIFTSDAVQNKVVEDKGKYIYVTDKETGKKKRVYVSQIDYFDEEGQPVLKDSKKGQVEDPNLRFILDHARTKDDIRKLALVPTLRELMFDLLDSDYFSLPENEVKELKRDMEDIGRLQEESVNLSNSLSDILTGKTTTAKIKQDIAEKKEKDTLKDKVDESSVSGLVEDMENGEINPEEVAGLFTDEDTEFMNNIGQDGKTNKQKLQEASKIIQTSGRMEDIIETLGEDKSLDPQEVQDALTLLANSKKVSESEQELLDLATQAFNDPNTLYDENDSSMEEVSREELESVLEERLDNAKTIIEEAKSILQSQNNELKAIPESASGEVVSTLNIGETGHDSVTKLPSENERKASISTTQEVINTQFSEVRKNLSGDDLNTFDNALRLVLNSIDQLLKNDTPTKEIGNKIRGQRAYGTIKSLAPTIDGYLNSYVKYKTQPIEERRVVTPTITEAELRRSSTQQSSMSTSTGDYQYWKPATSYLPFGKAYEKGNNTPFYKLARKLRDEGVLNYTDAQLQRIEAVGEYLDNADAIGAFKRVDSGALMVKGKEKVEIHFVVDGNLNAKAGELVILMTDKEGNVVGDIMSPNDATFDKQIGLRAFVERVTQAYEKAGSPDFFKYEDEVTTVAKNMVGKAPFLADNQGMNTLNEVFNDGTKEMPFTIGIAVNSGKNARILMSAGRTKKQGQSAEEQTINPPLTAKAGQPFLLLPTSSAINHYMPIPFMMEPYNESTKNTALGQAIHKALNKIATSDNSNAIKIIEELEELISVQEIHINYDNAGNVKVTIKPNLSEHQMSIYNGPINATNIVEQLEQGLQGQPFQVSRKYMNDTYAGQDYNKMIGEIAKVNLPIGTLHTVSDWFEINPLDGNGEQIKAKTTKSTGSNPFSTEMDEATITMGNTTYVIDLKNWDVTDGTKIIEGTQADLLRAHAWGLYTNKNMTKPYDTSWGYYNPNTNQFEKKPAKPTVVKSLNASTPTTQEGNKESKEEKPAATEKVATITNPQDKKTYTVKIGEVRRIDDGMYPGVSTIIDIKDDGTIVDSYYDEVSETTMEIEWKGDSYTQELAYATLISPQDIEATKTTPKQAETKTTSTKTPETPAQLRDKAKKAGLLGTKIREALWETLTTEQQSIIANKRSPIQKQWMSILESAWNPNTGFDKTKLKGTVDDLLGRKGLYRKVDTPKQTWDRKKELKWLQKALPQLSNAEHLRIIEGVEKLAIEDGGYAYGMFKNGVITLAGKTASGTLYHEAFHAVALTLLNNAEHQQLLDAAKEKWGNLDTIALEEQLAEDFRRYVQFEETPIIGSLVKLYRTLKHLIQKLVGKEPYLNRLYYNINRGKFAKRKVDKTDITRFFKESYTTEMQSIKDKAIADGTFMKAPNGNPTNLTERQWLQVRTKNFINWFGDWISNPFAKNVSLGAGTFNADNADRLGYRPEFPFFVDGEFAGSFHFENLVINRDGENITDDKYLTFPEVGWALELEPEFRGKGYGKAMYYEAAKLAARKGRSLRSASLSNMSEDAKHVWDSLVKNGYARLEDNHYVFNNEKLNYSKVVDENGEPLVVIHSNYGTSVAISTVMNYPYKVTHYFELDSRDGRYQKGINYEEFNNLNDKQLSILFSNAYLSFNKDYIVITQSKNALKEDRVFNFEHNLKEYKKAKKYGYHVDSKGKVLPFNPKNFIGNVAEVTDSTASYITTYFTNKANEKYSNMFGNVTGEYFLNIRNMFDAKNSTKEVRERYLRHNDFGSFNINGEALVKDGYDGATDYAPKRPEWVVTSSNQIKSATDNNGMFSTENDDIRYRRLDVYNIQQQINKLRNDYTRAKVYENSIRSTDRSVVDEAIKDTGLSHMLLSYLQNNNGKWSIARISKERLNDLIKPLQDELTKAYERELSDDEKLSRQMLEEQEAYYRRVEQYHRDKLMFDNLTQEDKDYIKDRGITIKEYNQMTQLEKEVLLHCQY